jgi:hypothetical protein
LNKYGERDNAGVFAAWERTMTEISDRLWICAEYMDTKSAYGCWNYGFSWKCSDKTSFILGYDVYNNKDLANTMTMQIDIDF